MSADSEARARIPRFYSTQMQIMVNALNKMPRTDSAVNGSQGVGVLMGNSLMFQRFPLHDGYDDPQLANFYGMALPFVKRGVPVRTVHIENLGYAPALDGVKVLVMTYSNMKPLDSAAHGQLAAWVRDGGNLVFSGTDADPFQTVNEWWNTNGMNYASPSAHLFETLGLDLNPAEGTYNVGRGTVTVMRHDPKEYVLTTGGDNVLFEQVRTLYDAVGSDKLLTKNNLRLDRGIYEVIGVLDESVSDAPVVVEGAVIDLYDPELTVYTDYTVAPGHHALLVHPDRLADKSRPAVLASASRESSEFYAPGAYSYIAKGPIETTSVSRVYLPSAPTGVWVNGVSVYDPAEWDATTHT
ncbi:MAG: hypothetical protein K2K86_01575, partial [Muribaculaceae bacterium]|nr:hypothetical protein [Muribaculaceae bacterium]